MNRLLPGTALLVSLSLGCSDGVEIPAVELGGSSGARLMNGQAKTPPEAYEKAYSTLSRAHYNVRRNLDARGQNQFGAREALRQILDCLDLMRSCVPPPKRPDFEPYLARYGDWLKDLDNGTWGGAFLTELDRTEREVKSKFNPATMELLAEFPDSTRPSPPERAPVARPATSRPADAGLTPDKVEMPSAPPGSSSDPERTAPSSSRSGKPGAPAATDAASPRILYRAWSAAHDELVGAYKDRKTCRAKYDDLIESLKLLKALLPSEKGSKLQIYIDYYGDVSEKTRCFTSLPAKTTEQDILDELDVAARVIRKEFNPEK